MNLKQLIKQKRKEYPNKMPKLLRIKIGKVIAVYASLPVMSAWAYLIAVPMMMPMSPTLWAKDKIRYFKEAWILK